jgi:hypothetical protein
MPTCSIKENAKSSSSYIWTDIITNNETFIKIEHINEIKTYLKQEAERRSFIENGDDVESAPSNILSGLDQSMIEHYQPIMMETWKNVVGFINTMTNNTINCSTNVNDLSSVTYDVSEITEGIPLHLLIGNISAIRNAIDEINKQCLCNSKNDIVPCPDDGLCLEDCSCWADVPHCPQNVGPCPGYNICTEDCSCWADAPHCPQNVDPCPEHNVCTEDCSCWADAPHCPQNVDPCPEHNICTEDCSCWADAPTCPSDTPVCPSDAPICTLDNVCTGDGVCTADGCNCYSDNVCTADGCNCYSDNVCTADGGCGCYAEGFGCPTDGCNCFGDGFCPEDGCTGDGCPEDGFDCPEDGFPCPEYIGECPEFEDQECPEDDGGEGGECPEKHGGCGSFTPPGCAQKDDPSCLADVPPQECTANCIIVDYYYCSVVESLPIECTCDMVCMAYCAPYCPGDGGPPPCTEYEAPYCPGDSNCSVNNPACTCNMACSDRGCQRVKYSACKCFSDGNGSYGTPECSFKGYSYGYCSCWTEDYTDY